MKSLTRDNGSSAIKASVSMTKLRTYKRKEVNLPKFCPIQRDRNENVRIPEVWEISVQLLMFCIT
jgi:hypothetical protein